MEYKEYKNGEVIFRKSQIDDNFYILLYGGFKKRKKDKNTPRME